VREDVSERNGPKTVLAVIPGPTYGGAANQVEKLREPLAERGYRMVAVLPDEPGNAKERLRSAGVEVSELPMSRFRASLNLLTAAAVLSSLPAQVGELRRLIRRFNAAIVQNHGDINPHAAVAARMEGRAVAWQLLDSRTPTALRGMTTPVIRHAADSVLVVGRALLDGYPGLAAVRHKCVVTPPPVDASLIRPNSELRTAARRELGVEENAILLGTIGNRNPQKGHDMLVRAAGRLRSRHPRLDLRILGAVSPGHEAYERRIRKALAECGFGPLSMVDPGARVPELIQAFDVFVMSSVPYSEGMPTVLFEAMAAGVPCVATDVGSVREVIADGSTGFVVEPREEELTRALAHLLDMPKRAREAMGAAGRNRVLQTFDLPACADRYAQAYELALANRRRRR
jgi:glycosyltransferase involved in cell wall biosynthesis